MDTAAAAAAAAGQDDDDDEQQEEAKEESPTTMRSPLSGPKRPLGAPAAPQPTLPSSRKIMATTATMGRGKGRNLPAWMTTTATATATAPRIVEPPVVPGPSPPQPPPPPRPPTRPRLWNVEWRDMPVSSSSPCDSGAGGRGGNNNKRGANMMSRKRGRSAPVTTSTKNNSSSCQRRVAVILFNGPNTSVLVQGRGSLCCTRGSVDIHGYRLTGGSNYNSTRNEKPPDINDDNNIDINSLTFLPFDVPAWSTSWLTITSVATNHEPGGGAQVIIQSAAPTTTPSTQQQRPPASKVKTSQGDDETATFSIHDAIRREAMDTSAVDDDAEARPTVLPDRWKQSASDILDDFHHHHHHQERQQPQDDSSCTAASLPSSTSLSESPPQVQNPPPPPPSRFVVAITGGKGVGKSTYLRYLLHRFMSLPDDDGHDDDDSSADDDNGDESPAKAQELPLSPHNNKDRFIAILDGDPGQPELGPVGMLTLTILQIGSSSSCVGCGTNATRTTRTTNATSRPLWSPPHCNMVLPPSDQQQPSAWTMPPPATHYERAYFYGSTTVQTDPQLYLECMSRLMMAYDQWQQAQRPHSTTTPLLINLHGWVKGLGFTLLQALLQQQLAPCRHVVQIMGTMSSQLFDLHSVLYNSSSNNKDHYNYGDDEPNENKHDGNKDNTTLLHVIPSFLDNHHPYDHTPPFAHGAMLPTTTSVSKNDISNNNTQEQQTSLSQQEQFISSSRAATGGTSSSSLISAKSFSSDEENNRDKNECFKFNEEEEQLQANAISLVDPAGTATAATTPSVPDSVVQDAIASLPPTESAGETPTPTLPQEAPAVSANSDIHSNDHHGNNKLSAVSAPSIPAAALRTLRLCTYFVVNTNLALYTWPQHDTTFSQKAGLHDPKCQIAQCLAAEKPYVVPMECLSIRHVFENNIINSPDEQQWWHLLNASIVGLCYDHEDDCVNSINEDGNGHAATAPPPPRCVGLGIVRSIDWQRKLLYLLTPIAPDQLARVHVLLVGGNLVLPLQCTFRGANAEAFPYQSQNSLSKMKHLAGAEPMKSRNNLVRRNAPAGPSWW